MFDAPLSRARSLSLVVTLGVAAAVVVYGLYQVTAREGLFRERFAASVAFPEVHEVRPGTAVRMRGLDIGRVAGIDYPESDDPAAPVLVRLELDAVYRDRLFADASAEIYATSLLGAKVIALRPGTPESGPYRGLPLKAHSSPSLAEAAEKLARAAEEAERLVRDARTGPGTVGRLLRDDDLYQDFKGLVRDSREQVQKLDGFVADGRSTLQSIKRNSEAVSSLPVIRGYIPEDALARLTRPDWSREVHCYAAADLFAEGSAILTEAGRGHVRAEAGWLKQVASDDAELVVAATLGPTGVPDPRARTLTQLRSEAVVAYLKEVKAHRLGWVSSRTLTAAGLGHETPPGLPASAPAATVNFYLLTPP